ncbi:MAG TPA: hypothetical protein VGQ91_00370 [Ideonella sp.]|jgi:hypothetical protein|nr:hypothetical protein [Ideonella sp.]
MPRTPAPSLDAWPGEVARPPLRLLDTPRAQSTRQRDRHATPVPMPGWLQRLRRLLRDAA